MTAAQAVAALNPAAFARARFRVWWQKRLRRTDTGDTVSFEQALARIRGADWLFTGPGSPSFALRQWAGTPVDCSAWLVPTRRSQR